ncbi:MAG: NADP-dependent oxidoreductase [Burkholderiales bacterium RIFCSPHIGHO2_12_FULL_61_11]|nr:MAG: NADP-dependent oxidoreductase [Burkholderiales bacterium RIFCSPHIGHO2_12_FULL_61_11]
MQYRNLGKSPLKISALCLGTMMFADQTDITEARSIVAHAREQGVNFIDTADVYSTGKSETMVGDILKGARADWILATKIGNKMSGRPNESQYSRSWMMRECDASLQRLATDYIDIYYLHRDFNGMDLEEPLRAIDALLRAGKIRYWGVSNFRGWRIAEVVHLARELNMPGPVVCQPCYNLLNRQPEVEVLAACAHYGIGVVPYSPIARGVLSGKYAPGSKPAEGTRAGRGDKRMMETEFREESLVIAQTLKAHCDRKGVSLTHFATAWVLANKAVSAVIAGPRTLAQWQDYFAALDCVISAEDEALVDSLVKPGHPATPGYNDPAYPLNRR